MTTVSPTYAREICEVPLGMGMEATLRARSDPVIGILNGVDYRDWDPRHDPHLTAHFSAEDLRGKTRQQAAAARGDRAGDRAAQPAGRHGDPARGAEGHRYPHRGAAATARERDFGLVVLGSGDERYATFFESLARRFAGRVAFRSGHDESLAHLIEAGSDMFLMPSHYEPCGLNQMYSLRYGTVPIVRQTGGLADSVRHFDPATGKGTGCVFKDYDGAAVEWALNTTLDWFQDQPSWRRLMHNAMLEDFSWSRQIVMYEKVFRDTASCRSAVPTRLRGSAPDRSALRFQQRVAAPVRQRIAMRHAQSRGGNPGRLAGGIPPEPRS